MKRTSTLFAFIAFSVIFACNSVFAAAPEKDSKVTKAKTAVKSVTSTASNSSSSGTQKGNTTTAVSPTPQDAQQTETANPQLPIPSEPALQPLFSPAAGEQIKWQVVSGGGSQGSSASYKLGSTIGQTAAGPSSSASYKLNAGFWQSFSSSCCVKEGDANHNNSVNVIDVTFIVSYLFKGGSAPICPEEADFNDNGSINVIDLTQLVSYLFKGGAITPCP